MISADQSSAYQSIVYDFKRWKETAASSQKVTDLNDTWLNRWGVVILDVWLHIKGSGYATDIRTMSVE